MLAVPCTLGPLCDSPEATGWGSRVLFLGLEGALPKAVSDPGGRPRGRAPTPGPAGSAQGRPPWSRL